MANYRDRKLRRGDATFDNKIIEAGDYLRNNADRARRKIFGD